MNFVSFKTEKRKELLDPSYQELGLMLYLRFCYGCHFGCGLTKLDPAYS